MNYHHDPLPGILSMISALKNSINELENLVHCELIGAIDRNDDLESWADPYASDGRAICNYDDEK
jgi:hypothetical protein